MDDIITIRFKQIDSVTWNCPFVIEDILYNISDVGCSVLCGKRKNCLMYSANQGRCVLTNHKLGLSETFNNYDKWYVQY